MSLLRAASLIAVLSLVSKAFGLVRDQVIAYYCGLDVVTDAYTAASLIPIQFALVMLGGLNGPFHSAVVSTLGGLLKREDKGPFGRILTSGLILILLSTTLIAILLFIFAPQIFLLWGEMPPETRALAVMQLRILAPAVVFSGLIGICYGILSIEQSFFTPSLSPIMASLGIIISLVLFSGDGAVSVASALAWGALMGAAMQLILQLIPLWRYLRGVPTSVGFKDPELKAFMWMLLPAVLSSSVGQLNVFIIQFFSSGLAKGSMSAFRFGNLLIQLPLGILLTALLVPLLPVLSMAARASQDRTGLKDKLNQGLRPIFMLTVPVTLLLIFFGHAAIVFLFQRGRWDAQASNVTYYVMVYMSLSITVYAIRDLLIRVFYALEDSRTPFMTSFVSILVMFIGAYLLTPLMGVEGIALASSLAAGANFVVLALLLRQRIGAWMQTESWLHFAKVMVASLPMLGLGWLAMRWLNTQPHALLNFIYALGFSALLMAIYLGVLILLRDHEVNTVLQIVKRRLPRR